MAILRLVARSPTPLTLKMIADSLGLVPSTVLHIVRALVAEEMLQVDLHTKQYRLGAGVLSLSKSLLRHSDFPNLVRPKLESVSREHGVTVLGAEAPNLRHAIVVAISSAPTMMRMHVDVGSRLPALASSIGRCIAAFGGYPVEEVKEQFSRLRRDVPPYATWIKQVETTRKQGYNIDPEYIAGLTIIGVPVLNAKGVMSHALAAVGISSQLNTSEPLALANDLLAIARDVASELRAR